MNKYDFILPEAEDKNTTTNLHNEEVAAATENLSMIYGDIYTNNSEITTTEDSTTGVYKVKGVMEKLLPSIGVESNTNNEHMLNVMPMQMAPPPQILSAMCNREATIYMSGSTQMLHPMYRMLFIMQLNEIAFNPECDSLSIELGSLIEFQQPPFMLGTIISLLSKFQKPIKTVAMSRCSFIETAIWLYGSERLISSYGFLQLTGVGSSLKKFPMFSHFIKTVYTRAKDIGLIDDNDVEMLMTTNKSICFDHNGRVELKD